MGQFGPLTRIPESEERMLHSRSSACRIPDNDKARDSTTVATWRARACLHKNLMEPLFRLSKKVVFGDVTIGYHLLAALITLYLMTFFLASTIYF